jgi:GntR family transcriptional regulator
VTDVPHQPQYRRIEQVLRERIATLGPGQRLPSDAELCAEFGVSRMTARNAMQRLAEEGLVAREPGRGSFVARPPAYRRANRLLTFTQEMHRRGLVPTSQLLTRVIRPATAAESAALGLPAHETVVHLRRLRCADDRPMAIESTVLIGATAPLVLEADLERGSLHLALVAGGITLRFGSGTIGSEPATAEDARLLGVPPGHPLLVERRVIADAEGRHIESTESRYPGDRYALDINFDVEEPDRPVPRPGAMFG